VLAAIAGARVELADQLDPGVRHLDRRISGLGDQPDPHRIGFGLELAAVAEQRQQGAQLGQLDEIAEIDPRTRPADSGEHRPDGKNIHLAPHVAPLPDHVPAEEMAAFVRDHAGKLGFAAHPQEEPGKDDRESAREHHRVEFRNPDHVDPHVSGGRAADFADQVPNVGIDSCILHDEVGSGDFFLDPVHLLPQALLVPVRGLEPRPDERDHVGGLDPRLGDSG